MVKRTKPTGGDGVKKRPFSLDIVGPSAGEYSASVVEVRPVERPDRLFAVITFALDWTRRFQSRTSFCSMQSDRVRIPTVAARGLDSLFE